MKAITHYISNTILLMSKTKFIFRLVNHTHTHVSSIFYKLQEKSRQMRNFLLIKYDGSQAIGIFYYK